MGLADFDMELRHGECVALMDLLQGADVAPTTQAVAACEATHKGLADLLTRWEELRAKGVKEANDQLRQANLPPLAP